LKIYFIFLAKAVKFPSLTAFLFQILDFGFWIEKRLLFIAHCL